MNGNTVNIDGLKLPTNLTLELCLEHSDIVPNNIILQFLKRRYRALRWTITGKKDYIYLTREVRSIRPELRVLRHELRPDGRLQLETSHGTITFFNP